MRGSVFSKLIAAAILIIALTAVSLDLLVRNTWETSLRNQLEQSLVEKARLLANRVNESPPASLQTLAMMEAMAAGARVTIIDSAGKVLADSEARAEQTENHATLPELKSGLRGETGVSTRRSATLHVDFLYVAVPWRRGAVRLAVPLAELEQAKALVRSKLLTASLLSLLIAGVVAAYLSRRISRRMLSVVDFGQRIAAGDLSAKINDPSSDEVGKLALSLNRTADNLRSTIQALEERKSQLESLLNSMQDAVVAVDEKERVKWANGAMSRLAGSEIALGVPLVDLVRNPDALNTIRESLYSRSVQRSQARFSSGKTFDVTAAAMPGGAVAVFHDVTEVERVEKTRRDFIANVSHELRTPLTSIQGYTETLLESNGIGKSQAQEFLNIVMKNASRMSRLTEDLLTLASVESGETKLNFESVPSAELLNDAAQIARERGMEPQILDESRKNVRCDKDAIHQVFSNLIENANKYAGNNKEVVLQAQDSGGRVEFSVTDFGPGIASQHLPRLFERFYRVDKARSLEAGGTGLGLAIVKHIVLAHAGSVRVKSELNRGATFFFSLPVTTVAAEK